MCCSTGLFMKFLLRVATKPTCLRSIRPFTSEIVDVGKGELVRDFISTSLYHPSKGYFNTHKVISTPSLPLNFGQFEGQRDYVNSLRNLYGAHSESWTTSVEIFSPTFGEGLLNWILSLYNRQEPLLIFEMGAGNGTCSRDILNCLKHKHPDIYETCTYTIMDLSLELCILQTRVLADHSQHVRIVNKSAADWNEICEDQCFFIGLEVI